MKTYVTLFNEASYLKGVLILYESLKRTHTRYPFTVLVTHCDKLEKELKLLNRIELIDSSFHVIKSESLCLPEYAKDFLNKYSFDAWINCFDKLLVFELTQFSKIVFLDSDTVVFKNVDSLFDKENMSCVTDSYWPLPFNDSERSLNSGVMVIEPEKGIVQKMLGVLPQMLQNHIGKPVGDQNLLQQYFEEWRYDQNKHLPLGYNFFFGNLHLATRFSRKWGGAEIRFHKCQR